MEDLIKDIKRRLVANLQLDRSPEEIDTDTPLFDEGLGLDSLDVLELVVMLDRDYGIEIVNMDEGKKAFVSVRGIAEYITAKKASS
jgi:acyl carrier protein